MVELPSQPTATYSARLLQGTSGGKVVQWGRRLNGSDILDNLTGVVDIANGMDHGVALLNNGSVIGWGMMMESNLLLNPTTITSSFPKVTAIAASVMTSYALLENGTVVTWGTGDMVGQPTMAAMGIEVVAAANAVDISAGMAHCMVLLRDGTVTVWGGSAPFQYGQDQIPAGLVDVKAVSAGHYHSVALLKDGTVKAWGWNGQGQTNVPVGLANVISIAAGYFHTTALLANGSIVMWGTALPGFPAEADGHVVQITTGLYHMLARLDNGTVIAWPQIPESGDVGQTNMQAVNLAARGRVTSVVAAYKQSFAIVEPPFPAPLPSPTPAPPPSPAPPPPYPSIPVGGAISSSLPAFTIATVVVGVVAGVSILLAVGMLAWWLSRRAKGTVKGSHNHSSDDPEFGKLPLSSQPRSPSTPIGPMAKRVIPPMPPMASPDGEISTEDLTLDQLLGQGSFGDVYEGLWKGKPVAIKLLNMGDLSRRARKGVKAGAKLMCDLRHPCVVPVYGIADVGTHKALVMGYCKCGSVADAMTKPDWAKLDLGRRLNMALQVARGVLALHEKRPKPMIHGALKTSNILINDDGVSLAVSDYGLSQWRALKEDPDLLELRISPPEMLSNPLRSCTTAGDVYAFAIVLLELITGQVLSSDMPAETCPLPRQDNGQRFTIPISVPEDVALIISACWAQEPEARPSMEEVVRMLRAALVTHWKGVRAEGPRSPATEARTSVDSTVQTTVQVNDTTMAAETQHPTQQNEGSPAARLMPAPTTSSSAPIK